MTTNNLNWLPTSYRASELREDPITGRRSVIAAGRADRPAAFARPDGADAGATASGAEACPFCAGRETLTPPEVWADRDPGTAPDTPGWRVRVIPNKYPAFIPVPPPGAPPGGGNGTGDAGRPPSPGAVPGAAAREAADAGVTAADVTPAGTATTPDVGATAGTGATADGARTTGAAGTAGAAGIASGVHEVVVHTPDHVTTISALPEESLAGVVGAWRLRLAALGAAWPGAVTVIVNQGRAGGASLEHSHSQIYATTFRPPLVRTETERLARPGCAACATLRREASLGARIVARHGGLITLCPWASIVPMEMLVLPAGHDPSFEAGRDDPMTVARALIGTLRALRRAIGFEPPVNLVLHTAPPGVEDFHWHLHAYPRLTVPAGYELGTGTMINVVDPDDAAARLRGDIGAEATRPGVRRRG